MRDLGEPETPLPSIEALRFDTRSPSGWILLVTLFVLPLESLILIIRFLNFPVVNKYSGIWITIVSKLNWYAGIYIHIIICNSYVPHGLSKDYCV